MTDVNGIATSSGIAHGDVFELPVDASGSVPQWVLPPIPTAIRSGVAEEVFDWLRTVAIDTVNQLTSRRWEKVVHREQLLGGYCRTARSSQVCGDPWVDLDYISPVGSHRIVKSVSLDGAPVPDAEWVQVGRGLWPQAGSDLYKLLASGFSSCDRVVLELEDGEDPPPIVVQAARDLLVQFVKRERGEECDLPSNVTSVTREGVTVRMSNDLADSLPSLKAAMAAAELPEPARMFNPRRYVPTVSR